MPRRRRTKDDIETLKRAIRAILEQEHPQTVRQVFYQLASRYRLIPKTENQYKNTVDRLLKQMRLEGSVPWTWVVDSSRSFYEPDTYDSLEQALDITRKTYRRSLLSAMDRRVEVWIEKEALAGVVHQVTNRWGVRLYPAKGYPSLSYQYLAAENIARAWEAAKPTTIYYFGDYDPSGVDISRSLEWTLRRFLYAGGDPLSEIDEDRDREDVFELTAEILAFERVAVLAWQIEAWELPTRPTKRSDSRAGSFGAESVELDAIPSSRLRELVSECIEWHVDRRQLSVIKRTEELERESLQTFVAKLGN